MKEKCDEISYACPCCGFLTLNEEPPGTWQICPVCRWEDDLLQFGDPSHANGANEVSLEQARTNYVSFGAKDQPSRQHARAPLPAEVLPKILPEQEQ